MQKQNNNLNENKITLKRIIPFALFGLYVLLIHVFGYELIGDDGVVCSALKPTLLEEFSVLERSYVGWSSRILINPIIWILYHFDIKVWGMANILIICIIFVLVKKLSGVCGHYTEDKIVLFVMLMFPYEVLCDTGWVSTSVSYFWPLAAGLFSCMPIVRYLDGKKTNIIYSFFVCISTVFATNKEELSLTLLIVFLYFVCLTVKNKKIQPLFVIQFFIALTSVLYHLQYTGNDARYDFFSMGLELSVFEKGIVGFVSTINHLFYGYDYLFICFSVIVSTLMFFIEKKWIYRFISLIPTMICIVSIVVGLNLSGGLIDSKALNKYVFPVRVEINNFQKYDYNKVILPLVISIVGLCCLAIGIYRIIRNITQYLSILIILAAGFIGRMTVGFSGNGYGDYARTYIIFYYVLIVSLIFLFNCVKQEITKKDMKKIDILCIVLSIIAMVKCMFGLCII